MRTLILGAALLLAAAGTATAELKVGVLDYQAIFQGYEGYDEAQNIFNRDLEAWQNQKQQMVSELLQAREDYEAQRLLFDPDTRQEREAEIARLEAELYEFEQAKFGPEGEAVRRNMELSEPIHEKIREVVKTVAEEEGYDLVLDVTGMVLYQKPDMLMNEKVGAALKSRG